MSSSWFARFVAAGVVIAGPILLVYGRSDLGPWSSFGENLLWSVPWMLLASAAAGYAAVKGLISETPAVGRTLLAVACAFVVLPVSAVAFLPLLFGLGEACNPWVSTVALIFMAIPGAAFQVAVLQNQRSKPAVEFFAYLIVCGGSITLGSIFVPGSSCGGLSNDQTHIFEAWPLLLAVLPLVVVAFRDAVPTPAPRLVLAGVLALAPLYLAKATLDYHQTREWRAALWPANVWTDFIGAKDRNALFRNVATIRAGVPVRIGEHWYQFKKIGFQNLMMGKERRPDRIRAIQLDIPADDLDLQNMTITGRYVQLNIGTRRQGQIISDSPSQIRATLRISRLPLSCLAGERSIATPFETSCSTSWRLLRSGNLESD